MQLWILNWNTSKSQCKLGMGNDGAHKKMDNVMQKLNRCIQHSVFCILLCMPLIQCKEPRQRK